jgi:hypothetical protein
VSPGFSGVARFFVLISFWPLTTLRLVIMQGERKWFIIFAADDIKFYRGIDLQQETYYGYQPAIE